MKQFAILLLSILLFSCNKKSPENNNTEIKDSMNSKSYIESYLNKLILTQPDVLEKLKVEYFEHYKIQDSLMFNSLNCTLYSVITPYAIDDDSYVFIMDNETKNFFKIIHSSWGSKNSSISIDAAYKILSFDYNIVEPVEFEFQGIEDFINNSANGRRNLTIKDIDPIFSNYYKLEKIIDAKEIGFYINKIKEDDETHEEVESRVYNKNDKQLITLLVKALRSENISIYKYSSDRMLYVELIPITEGAYNLRFIRIG